MQGLAEELSKDGACDRAIFPDTAIVITRCAIAGNLTLEGVSNGLYYTFGFLARVFCNCKRRRCSNFS